MGAQRFYSNLSWPVPTSYLLTCREVSTPTSYPLTCREVMGCRRRNSKLIFVMGVMATLGMRRTCRLSITTRRTITSWMKKVWDNRVVVDPIAPVTSLFGIMKNNDD